MAFYDILFVPREKHCHRFIADSSSKVPDDEALVIPEIPVNGQLGLSGNLGGRGRKQIRSNECAETHNHTYIDFTPIISIDISTAATRHHKLSTGKLNLCYLAWI